MTCVYWIRQKDHTDIFSQGYVGVSSRFSRRLWEHENKTQNAHFQHAIKKYGWDSLIKEKVIIGDEDYCYEMEAKLRPTEKMGWNLVVGGGKPPNFAGKKRSANFVAKAMGRKDSPETRLKKSLAAMGNKNGLGKIQSAETRAKIGEKHKGNKHCLGKQNGLKYTYIGTNIKTGEQVQVTGNKQIKDAGFHTGHINDCAMGKQKSHKGYIWIKESIK
jgi:hypothetical protein